MCKIILFIVLFISVFVRATDLEQIQGVSFEVNLELGKYDIYLCPDVGKDGEVQMLSEKGKPYSLPFTISCENEDALGYVELTKNSNRVCLHKYDGDCDENGLCTSYILPDLCSEIHHGKK